MPSSGTTCARRPYGSPRGWADEEGALVLLSDQDRSRWDRGRLAEGRTLAEAALARRRPGPYQLQAAIAVTYAEGPAAGLAILDTLAASSRLARWPQLHIARGALLAQCGRREDAIAAYRDALALEPAGAVRAHVTSQIAALGAAPAPTQET